MVLGVFKSDLRWFKKVLVVIVCYLSNIKLQMDSMGRDYVLEGRDQDQKMRNNLFYSSIIGVGSVWKRFKVV